MEETCGHLSGCFLRDLENSEETPLEVVNEYRAGSGRRWSVRCEVQGAIDYVKFRYNGTVQDEFQDPWYMGGDYNGWINDVEYLGTCQTANKTIRVSGFLWNQGDSAPCFENVLELDSNCDDPTHNDSNAPSGTSSSTPSLVPSAGPPSLFPSQLRSSNSPSFLGPLSLFPSLVPSAGPPSLFPSHFGSFNSPPFLGSSSLVPSLTPDSRGSILPSILSSSGSPSRPSWSLDSLQPSFRGSSEGSMTASRSLQPSFFVTPPPENSRIISARSTWAVDGNTLVSGRTSDPLGYPNYGSVQSLLFDNGTEQQLLVPVDAVPAMRFGASLAVENNVLVVGAPGDHHGWRENYINDAGSVYIYTRQNVDGEWMQQSKLLTNPVQEDDHFGTSIVLQNDTLVVGAYDGINFNKQTNGALYVFQRVGDDWVQRQRIEGSLPENELGASMEFYGDTLFVGEPTDSNAFSGRVNVYKRSVNGTMWSLDQVLEPSSTRFGRSFGTSMSVNGDVLMVGSPASQGGEVFVFGLSENGQWVEKQRLVASDTDFFLYFGLTIAVHGSVAVVGSRRENFACENIQCGQAYVFRKGLDNIWMEEKILRQERGFGQAIGFAGNSLLVSSWNKIFVYDNY